MSASWSASELERVPHCPVCGGDRAEVLHDGLEDRVFFVAAGTWRLKRCSGCGCAFLDPRPTRATIHRAYQRYYTHEPARAGPRPAVELSLLRRLRRGIASGYLNWRFGAERPGALPFGHLAALLFPRQRALLDAEFRHLPRRPAEGARLLDIGCGNGDFLAAAQRLGWEAIGVDMDAAAVRAAQSQGCDARLAAVDSLDFAERSFDAITISHVIEHVHNPVALLRHAFDLLKPGATLYVETPNIDSAGARQWDRHWRGLEPPRHLVLFNHAALARALEAVGFDIPEFHHRGNVTAGIWRQSANIAAGRPPLDSADPIPLLQLARAEFAARRDPRSSEFITAVARRPR